ncbi:cysteine dioxygenase [Rhodocyclus tenuis]|uniref:Cysteine dioxygenase n=2 Tax=Rhodocyclus TaxID=1064 RepID=A0A6L5K0D9_RHOTE|nr:cysteine dioxygenase [Rhodocyclus gracilis]MQY52384.1 cysteine dioxygenase [Rhodocyclus gracilis]NJA88291.1 cysteine dioxygenase [Rhodocyclus gracilis]
MSANKLLNFVEAITRFLETDPNEELILSHGQTLLAELVASDDWLPDQFARPHPQYYQQYLLYADPLDRLSIVSFVWGPGQKTPVHDHLTWGLVGGLRGREREMTYAKQADGSYRVTGSGILLPGQTTAVSPGIGDVHSVANDLPDQSSISIHVYGRNIGRVHRHVFDEATGAEKPFVSGYASDVVPNLWS